MLRSFFLLLLLGTALFAEKIDRFTVDIMIEQSGELAIEESIDYNFENRSRHGIYRDIPYQIKYDGVLKDIGLYNFRVMMDDMPVKWEKSTQHSQKAGALLRIKIGSASSYLSGKHRYTIAYRVKLGVLPAAQNPNNDAVRWNIIGTGWAIPIENVTARFHLPASLEKSLVTLSTYTGAYGTTSSSASTRWLNDRELLVTAPRLAPYEGMTVELAFPPGLLDQSGIENVTPTLADWFAQHWHWAALVAYLLYFFNSFKHYVGFEDRRSVAVRYLPPKGLSVLQSGLLLDKYADDEDFAAAVIELAQLGYIEIEQTGAHTLPVLLRTDKADEGLTNNQRYLLEAVLFPEHKRVFAMKHGDQTLAQHLKSGFAYINNNLYNWAVKEGYMSENPKQTRKRFLLKHLLLLLPLILYTFYSLFQKVEEDIFILVFPIVFGAVGIQLFLRQPSWAAKLQGLIFLGAGLMPLVLAEINGLDLVSLLTGPFGVLLLLLGVLFYLYKKVGRFTRKGAYTQKQLLGLEEFVKRVKTDEIKRRLALDPLYLDKMLPYAILFGHADHWLEFYSLMQVDTPSWYHGDINDLRYFGGNMHSAATPPSQSSGGGGFSGGGAFSGGGGGGGGGGSW